MSRTGLLAAVLLAFAARALADERPWTPLPSPQSATCPGGLCQPDALVPFFRAMDGRRGNAVDIVQFGDSHTAGQLITNALTGRLQARFSRRVIRLDAIGVVGVTLTNLVDQSLPFDMPHPALIIIAYGTNEGFDDDLDPVAYDRLLRAQIARFRATAPEAAILILGAPEAMRGGGGGTCPGDPDQRWAAPPMLAVVRDVQYRVAAETGVAFWDWRGRMGGQCSAERLTLGDDPFMRGDHVHFTGAGADWIGGLLFADLQAAGQAWYSRGGR